MNNQEYEQKKQECWQTFCQEHPLVATADAGVAFCAAFDRAYTLGREKETISQEKIEEAAKEYSDSLGKSRDVTWNDAEYGFITGANFALGKQFGNPEQVDIEKAAEKFADEIKIPASIPGVMVPFINGLAHDAYQQGAQDFLGKQEKDAESVIRGWVARDKDGDVPLFVGEGKPYRNKYGEFISCPTLYLPRNEFPYIISDREPIEVELIIKRKKNGNNSTDNRI